MYTKISNLATRWGCYDDPCDHPQRAVATRYTRTRKQDGKPTYTVQQCRVLEYCHCRWQCLRFEICNKCEVFCFYPRSSEYAFGGSTIYRIGNSVLLTTVLGDAHYQTASQTLEKNKEKPMDPGCLIEYQSDRYSFIRSHGGVRRTVDASKEGWKEYCGGAKQG